MLRHLSRQEKQDILRQAYEMKPGLPVPLLVQPFGKWYATQEVMQDWALDLIRQTQRIREQEQAVQSISQELKHASGTKGFDIINDLSWKYAKAQAELEKLTHEWEKLVEKA